MPFRDCGQLARYVVTGKLPQGLDSSHSVTLPQSAELLDRADLPARGPSTLNLFQPVPESQLASLTKLPLLRQRLGYAIAQVGSVAALSKKYQPAWSSPQPKIRTPIYSRCPILASNGPRDRDPQASG
jgi:hypothetical protein